jgi:ATP-dependent Clp protease protease subunit
MFAVYDVMRMIRQKCTIKTTGLGKVMSAGVLLLASGTKGFRRIGKHCRVMLHSAASGHVGELYNLENELEELKMTQKAYIKTLSSETDMSSSYLKKLLNKRVNVYLTAQEALDLGIVDEII